MRVPGKSKGQTSSNRGAQSHDPNYHMREVGLPKLFYLKLAIRPFCLSVVLWDFLKTVIYFLQVQREHEWRESSIG